MRKLSKSQQQVLETLRLNLETKRDAITEAVDQFNEQMAALFEETVKKAVDEYNEELANAKAFTEEIAGEMHDYFNERSEKWQEGDAGDNYGAWNDEWENIELDEVEVEAPDAVDDPHPEHVDDLTSLNIEPGL